ncbi:AraC family transcriptional regulator [Thioclava sp. SK-1]|nr:AraC family transcriptional regulator [Thioclava sp. SK-1]
MVRILQVARLAQGGKWRVEAMRALSEPCLYWFTRGQGRITVGGITRGYGPHNAVFVPAGMMHAMELGPQTQGTAIFLGRNTDLTLPHTAQHLRIRDAAPQSEFSNILESVQREMDSTAPGADRAARHHLGLLGVWLERQIAQAPADSVKPSAARRLVGRYSALLERDFKSGNSISDYAQHLGVTPTHLTRACKSACGRSALDLLQDRRLYEARRLLSDSTLSVKDISLQLGFKTPSYFTRAFHARTGATPSGFRRKA